MSFKSAVYLDASRQGYGGYVVSSGNRLICHGHWNDYESRRSSTWHEAKTISNMLQSVGASLLDHNIQWYTDNTNVVNLIHRGSIKADLQEVAGQIVELCSSFKCHITPCLGE